MYFPELNDIISDLQMKKSRAIENLDFENAEEIQNVQKQEINRRSELQAKHISDCAIEEYNKIKETRNKNLLLIEKKYENSKNEIETKFNELFEEAQSQQTSEITEIDERLQILINEEKSKPIQKVEELLMAANKQARLGNIQASKNIKSAADKAALEDFKNRCDIITQQINEEKEEMIQKHAIEARNLINLKNAELKEIEKDKIKSIEKVENLYKASINALKSKCDVQCGVLSGDPEINRNYSIEIIQNIESLEKDDKNLNDEQQRLKNSQKLRDETLSKTMKIMNRNKGNYEDPDAYLKKTAKKKVKEEKKKSNSTNSRILSKSFFLTQNTKI